MAAVGAEFTSSWFLASGVISFFILLLLLSIFLTALCTDCKRRSFELREPQPDKYPPALIRVVKLEEVARENPMINEIQNDEKEFKPEGNSVPITQWSNHMGAPQHQDGQTNGSTAVKTGSDLDAVIESNSEADESVTFTPWRSHLLDSDSTNIYQTIEARRRSGDASSRPTICEPAQDEGGAADLSDRDRNSVYARVSKKVRLDAPPVITPEKQVEDKEEEEEPSPPLPDRKEELEG
ncbi:uncharacterized protein si:ch73-204p21.2 [Scomber japonicus]|uniref:uncharacterized protein si:ch73-204p21.2 n=1 Tax=Scomber japonicus TaxID=13676 RepID=UPI0023062785|nr:uncharacterized protein si:ch73-204p21.2 [Scomber japonicus]